MHTLKRGADGWRGVIGEQFSTESAVHLSLAIARFLIKKKGAGILLVTHDGRLQSKPVADAIVRSLIEGGLDVAYGGMQSTPATSQALSQENWIGAILVTASHNPFYWNGIKVKIAPGMPPSREDEEVIEKILQSDERLHAQKKGVLYPIDREKIFAGYVSQILNVLTESEIEAIRRRKFKIVVDALHGVSGDHFRCLFEHLGCDLTVLGGEPDPLFNGMLPNPMNPISRRRIVKQMEDESYDFGFISDGDGDRICVLDERGEFVWPHDILGLIFEEIAQKDQTMGGLAVTGPTGSIAERICKRLKRRHIKTPVGFKYASQFLQNKDAIIAGGAVGEIGYSSLNMDRDPLTSALLLLHICVKSKKSLSGIIDDLKNRYGHSVYKQWTVSRMPKGDPDLKEFGIRMVENLGYRVKEILNFDGEQLIIDDVAWILIRKATTEDGIRIYAELHDQKELDQLFEFISMTTQTIPEETA